MIRLEHHGHSAELILARADARNAINRAWVDALAEAVAELRQDGTARALLIRAEGPAFTVGGDLAHFNAHLSDLSEELGGMIGSFHASLLAIAELPLPVLCAAHGSVAGGGLGLLWASDIVLLAAGTRLTTAFAKLGLSGDGGSSWYLPRMVGERRALELMYESDVISADRALELGLANQVVAPAEELLAIAREQTARLAAAPTGALAQMRRLVRGAARRTAAEGLEAELAACIELGAGSDVRAGIIAFTSGERPNFTGR